MIQTDAGKYIKPVAGFSPQASDGTAAIEGPAIDRTGFLSAVLHGRTGAVTGAPTAQTYDLKLQESADGSTWTDIPGAAITQITAADTEADVNVNLAGAEKYIRAVGTVTFTGGTTPTLQVAATVILGGADVKPV